MAMTVVGLFGAANAAQTAMEDLIANGFSRDELVLYGQAAAPGYADVSELGARLHDAGVPPEEASLYVEGIRQGGSLNFVHTSDDRADTALEIMNRHGAVDIHSPQYVHRFAVPMTVPGPAPVPTPAANAAPEADPVNTGDTVAPTTATVEEVPAVAVAQPAPTTDITETTYIKP